MPVNLFAAKKWGIGLFSAPDPPIHHYGLCILGFTDHKYSKTTVIKNNQFPALPIPPFLQVIFYPTPFFLIIPEDIRLLIISPIKTPIKTQLLIMLTFIPLIMPATSKIAAPNKAPFVKTPPKINILLSFFFNNKFMTVKIIPVKLIPATAISHLFIS